MMFSRYSSNGSHSMQRQIRKNSTIIDLDLDESTDQGFPPHYPSINDIDTTGLTPALRKELSDVSRTLTPFPKQMNTCSLYTVVLKRKGTGSDFQGY